MALPILQELQWRGLVADMANREELEKLLAPGAAPVTVYVGFDPTSDSLQLGNLIGLIMLRRFQLAGHRPSRTQIRQAPEYFQGTCSADWLSVSHPANSNSRMPLVSDTSCTPDSDSAPKQAPKFSESRLLSWRSECASGGAILL